MEAGGAKRGKRGKRGTGGTGGKGGGGVAPPPSLDVFAYPSDMMHMASILPSADGQPPEGGTTDRTTGQLGAGFCGPHGASAFSADVAGWDFVSHAPAVTGARLWQRVRTRLDLLARTQGMSRRELLIYVLLTLAAHPTCTQLHI